MNQNAIDEIVDLLQYLMSDKEITASYDHVADTLHIDFAEQCLPDFSELREDDIVIKYENKEVVGIAVHYASERDARYDLLSLEVPA